jgi:hypothetical protein
MHNYIAQDTLRLSDVVFGRSNHGIAQTNAIQYDAHAQARHLAYMQDALNIPREKHIINHYNHTLLLVDDI